jgi:hypothetical protein
VKAKKQQKRKPKPRGPKPEILKIEGDWKDAIRESLKKKRPAGGWPKPGASEKSIY